MFLVVGLAIAVVVGIAVAFYFSLRSGSGGRRRLRSVGASRAGTDRRPGSGSAGTARRDRTTTARRATNGSRAANTVQGANASSRNYQAEVSTGPNPVLDIGEPARLTHEAHTAVDTDRAVDADRTARPRRRVGFRKGADVDEELWPTELFGGVSDEQFWDDLASDKPLTTTARTAQQDPRTGNRSLNAVPPSAAVRPAGIPPVAAPPAATRPVQGMTPQVPGAATQPVRTAATQPVRTAAGTSQLMSAPSHEVNSSHQVNSSQPVSAAAQPVETRGRRRASRSDDEDPLTSAAFSLRSSGPVDGRSSRRSRDMTRERYDVAVTQETQTFTAAETEAASSGYPGGMPPFRQSESPADRSPSSYSGTSHGAPSSITQAMNTSSYEENYGYANGGSQAQPAQPEDPRRHNGTRRHARHGGNDEVPRAARQSYPQDRYQGTGSHQAEDYQGTGSHQADGYPTGGYSTGGYSTGGYSTGGYPTGGYPTGGYPTGGYPDASRRGNANGYQGNGHRAPYDPRADYRRLTYPG